MNCAPKPRDRERESRGTPGLGVCAVSPRPSHSRIGARAPESSQAPVPTSIGWTALCPGLGCFPCRREHGPTAGGSHGSTNSKKAVRTYNRRTSGWKEADRFKHPLDAGSQEMVCRRINQRAFSKTHMGDFPGGGSVVKTLCSQCRGPGFDPWSGN